MGRRETKDALGGCGMSSGGGEKNRGEDKDCLIFSSDMWHKCRALTSRLQYFWRAVDLLFSFGVRQGFISIRLGQDEQSLVKMVSEELMLEGELPSNCHRTYIAYSQRELILESLYLLFEICDDHLRICVVESKVRQNVCHCNGA